MTTAHDLALLRLVAQRVVGPSPGGPADVVAWLLAAQAQDLPGVLASVALRTTDRSEDGVRAAFDAGEVVRTWPMRGTLHAVRAEDAAWLVALCAAGPMTAMARRRVELGLPDDVVARAERLLVDALAGGGALTRKEALAVWTDAGVDVGGGRGYQLLAHLAHARVVCLGPMRGKEQAFVLLDEWVPRQRRLGTDLDRDEALAELALRFCRSHGPATDRDLSRWAGLPLRDVRAGIGAAGDALTTLEVDATTYHLDPALPDLLAEHRAAARGVHLLPGFDEVVLGYADRSVTVPPEHAARIVPGGNGVFRPTVLHDGVAVGTWRWTGSGRNRRRAAEPFTTFPAAVTEALAGS